MNGGVLHAGLIKLCIPAIALAVFTTPAFSQGAVNDPEVE
jgi:hypothetical protein